MSNGNQSHTKVTQVEIVNDNVIQVTIEADAFMPGQSVEISGYVAQNHGAFATVNEFQKIDTKLGEIANLTVTATPAPGSDPFEKGQDVMVFLRAAKVWVTVLGEGQAQPEIASYNLAAQGTVWGREKGAAGAESYSDTREGNQPGSTTGGAGQEAPDEPRS